MHLRTLESAMDALTLSASTTTQTTPSLEHIRGPSPAEMMRMQDMYEERLHKMSVESHSIIMHLEAQLADAHATINRLEKDLHASQSESQHLQSLTVELQSQAREHHESMMQMHLDVEDLSSRLEHERNTNERHESDFRVFSRKMRLLQDRVSEVLAENEGLKGAIRRMQFEAGDSSVYGGNPSLIDAQGVGGGGSVNQAFYKDRLDQGLYDNENSRMFGRDTRLHGDGNGSRGMDDGNTNWHAGGDRDRDFAVTAEMDTLTYYYFTRLFIWYQIPSQLTFELSRIPANGAKNRKRQTEIEELLDEIDRKMAAVRKRLKQMGAL
eukprot:jgi/Hompol1/5203/HPOL_004298-RA